jgi:epoxyqueuosine reductase
VDRSGPQPPLPYPGVNQGAVDRQLDTLLAIGREAGLDSVGVAPAAVLERARAALLERRRQGLDGGMQFTYRNPQRSTDPSMAVAGARSIIVGARAYAMDEPPRPDHAAGRVARYAWVDHYRPLRVGLWAMAKHLRTQGFKAVAFADDNSIVDREAAYLGGLGWFGKNANLLLPKAGSLFVLGCVITDAPLPAVAEPIADGCGGCRRCIDGCPTAAIVAPGVVDANRCLSWLLQKPGTFPLEFREALGDRIYGCDDCQDVCPPNARFLQIQRRSDWQQPVAWVPLVELLTLSDHEVMFRHGSWYIHQGEVRWVRRNALVALGNVGDAADPSTRRVLGRYLACDDPMLREHAAWAAKRLGLDALEGFPAGTDISGIVLAPA